MIFLNQGNKKNTPPKQAIMIKSTFFLAILLIFVFISSSNTDSPDILYWTPDYRLTWNDFEGIPAYEHDNISALTSSGIVHYAGCKDGKIIYKIQAYFEKNSSWVKSEALTAHHLKHEQIHFDITELHARRLRKELENRNFPCGEEAAFESFVTQYLRNWESDQSIYDLNTQHSIDEEKQTEWFHKVARELELLSDYAAE